jgi:hypothetical protein
MIVAMATILRVMALTSTVLVLLGLATFAADEASSGSEAQVRRLGQELGDPAPTAGTERARERRHGPVRELIDDSNDLLLAPFADASGSREAWSRRLVATGLAVLVYGLGLTLVANYLPRRRLEQRDWRTPA